MNPKCYHLWTNHIFPSGPFFFTMTLNSLQTVRLRAFTGETMTKTVTQDEGGASGLYKQAKRPICNLKAHDLLTLSRLNCLAQENVTTIRTYSKCIFTHTHTHTTVDDEWYGLSFRWVTSGPLLSHWSLSPFWRYQPHTCIKDRHLRSGCDSNTNLTVRSFKHPWSPVLNTSSSHQTTTPPHV